MDRRNVALECGGVLDVWLELLMSLFFAMGCTPLAFFQANCPCCTPVNCGTGCSSTPSSISVTVTGYSNNGCSTCADYDATYICTRDTIFPTQCQYIVYPALSCQTAAQADSVTVTLSALGGQTTIAVVVIINGSQAQSRTVSWQDLALGASRQDCAGLGTITVPWLSTSATPTPRCDHDGSDATVTFS